jgi:hypothetical protein
MFWGQTCSESVITTTARGFCGLPITKERILHHKMALEGQPPSEDPAKRQEFFYAEDGIVSVKWKVGIDRDNHVMCDCTRFWKGTVCQHAYHFKHGSPALSNPNGAGKPGSKRRLNFGNESVYSRGKYWYQDSGFVAVPKSNGD